MSVEEGERVFVDTNVLIYAYDRDARERHEIARDRLARVWRERSGCISTQVLQEFYVNVTRKLARPITPSEARRCVRDLKAWRVVEVDVDDVIAASEIAERHVLSFWDALIVRAAVRAGARTLLTEDLNAGQVIEGVRVENPFAG